MAKIEEPMATVRRAYKEFPIEICKKIWTTLQLVINQILLTDGCNTYKPEHIDRDKLKRCFKQDILLWLPCMAQRCRDHIKGNIIALFTSSRRQIVASDGHVVHLRREDNKDRLGGSVDVMADVGGQE